MQSGAEVWYLGGMPGRPLRRKMLAALSDHGGVDWVLERVANGEPLRQIAADLGCTRALLSDWMLIDPERRAAYFSARASSAHAVAEQALAIADNASETGTSKARLQVETRQWLAGVYDRETYGAQKNATQVNIGMLHIDAMRRANTPAAPMLSPLESTTIEVQSNDATPLLSKG